MFSKYGLLVLYNHRGETERIYTFKKSLHRLIDSLEIAYEEYKNPDKKRDIKIMYSNILLLVKDFNKNYE